MHSVRQAEDEQMIICPSQPRTGALLRLAPDDVGTGSLDPATLSKPSATFIKCDRNHASFAGRIDRCAGDGRRRRG